MSRPDYIFGAAYYEEYLPCDRMEQDFEMMKAAGLNTIRIAESTWAAEEPRPGEYDFSHVDRVIEAAARHGLSVIVGTPTYAIPSWLARLDPEVMAETCKGRNPYGPRQKMDITNPTYRAYAERIIRALVSRTAGCPNVIGFQIDNETKHYDTAGPRVQAMFRKYLAKKYKTADALNKALGLYHWSNSVADFEDLPDPTATINGSYAAEFERFKRSLAADFLQWQADIVNEYRRPDQFITHNFDFEWHSIGAPGHQDGYGVGVQPKINHSEAVKAVTLPGCDIYCPDEDKLTGREIAFGGDLIRSLKQSEYLVLETQAQAFKNWLPYPGQLRQMSMSHLANGACGQMYWHWFSLHSGIETYWKGILGHDFAPNPVYDEISRTGAELKALAPRLSGLKKRNKTAILVSNEALTGLKLFPTDKNLTYNDILMRFYDALYEMNIECDIIFPQADFNDYDLLIVPALYAVSDEVCEKIRTFTETGGVVVASFRSFFADEACRVRQDAQPHGLTDVFGVTYNTYTGPANVTVGGVPAEFWMELLVPKGAKVLEKYEHKYWGSYAAATRHLFGGGSAYYLGTLLPKAALQRLLLMAAGDAGIEAPAQRFPVILRSGISADNMEIHFLFNYSSDASETALPYAVRDLQTGERFAAGDPIPLKDWDARVLQLI